MSPETDESAGTASPLAVDSALVRQLAALLHETGLSEIEYAAGDRRIRVARGGSVVHAVAAAGPAPAMTAQATPDETAPAQDHPGAVKSPMVGTAYLSPAPEAPVFVKPGDTVAEGQVLLIVEAMKVMNQIRAPRGGRVARILVADGAPVEFGQPLMILE